MTDKAYKAWLNADGDDLTITPAPLKEETRLLPQETEVYSQFSGPTPLYFPSDSWMKSKS